MVLELIHNFNISRRKLIVLCLIVLLSLCGCDGKYGNYPYDRALRWDCSDPQISIEWFANEHGLITENKSVINWKGKQNMVFFDFHSSFFDVFPYGSNYHDDRLLSGTWEYRNSDLILIIDEDFLFEDQYNELIFSPVA